MDGTPVEDSAKYIANVLESELVLLLLLVVIRSEGPIPQNHDDNNGGWSGGSC